MRAPRLDDIHAATDALSDRAGIAEALVAAMAAIAPRGVHAVTFFSGPASLVLDVGAARIDGGRADVADLADSYTTSAVMWNRWAVAPRDRDRLVRVATPSATRLSRYWAGRASLPAYGWSDYRRQVVCVGARAVALVGTCAPGGVSLGEATWSALESCITKTAAALRLAAFRAGALDDTAGVEAVAYLSRTGAILASANDVELVDATGRASELLRERSATRSFTAGDVRYELRASETVRGADVVELVATRGSALSERDAELVEWVRRGLTNREVAAMLAVPPTTVKKALERLFARYGASNRIELLTMMDGVAPTRRRAAFAQGV